LKKGEKGSIAIVFDGEKLLLYHNGKIKNKKRGQIYFFIWGCGVIGSTVVSGAGRDSIPLSSTNK
jgi:hypothetical protein